MPLPAPVPHPHVDPRQPRHDSRPATNPPVFAWRPRRPGPSALLLSRDATLQNGLVRIGGLDTPIYLPPTPLAPGRWYWTWQDAAGRGPVHAFDIAPDALALSVPEIPEWTRRLPADHPRFLVRPEELASLRAALPAERPTALAEALRLADEVLAEPHHLPEPPPLADPARDHAAFLKGFLSAMWDSRRFMKGAETLALAHLATGRADYARAARERVLSVADWDPEGSTSLSANDEAHMSILWYGAAAADWTWDAFSAEERARVVACLRARGVATFAHIRHEGIYGVEKFDSHAGRQIVLLGLLSLAFHHEIPESAEWLAFLRPVLCGVWPVWAGDDGAWAEGPAYGMTYVGIMSLFASALKRGVGVDLYQRPFWRGHLAWRRAFWPAYAEWIGFGDHNERWDVFWGAHADVCEAIARETAAPGYAPYIDSLRAEIPRCHAAPAERRLKGLHPLRLLAPGPLIGKTSAAPASAASSLAVFPAAGWAALRTVPDTPSRDIAFFFRSSPFGSISHSHAANLDFILHVAGRVLLMPSGFYDGYATPHHSHWVWHTKSHNCLTLADAGQRLRSPEAVGSLVAATESEEIVSLLGEADASYPGLLTRCRRHVVFFKSARCLLLIDDVELPPDSAGALQWNAHSWSPFVVDETARSFRVERGEASLTGHVLHHGDAWFRTSSGWDPAPLRRFENLPWDEQHHLRFTPLDNSSRRRRLGVLLRLEAPAWSAPVVTTSREGAVETALVGPDIRVEVLPPAASPDRVARIQIHATAYELHSDRGLLAL